MNEVVNGTAVIDAGQLIGGRFLLQLLLFYGVGGNVREKSCDAQNFAMVFVIKFMAVDAVEASPIVGIGKAKLLGDVVFLYRLREEMKTKFFQRGIQLLASGTECWNRLRQMQYRGTAGGKVHFVVYRVIVKYEESGRVTHPEEKIPLVHPAVMLPIEKSR